MTKTEKVQDVEHSPLGASGIDRWGSCAGSVNLIKSLGPKIKRSGEAAAEGTVAHRVGEMCLRDDKDTWEFVGEQFMVDGFTFIVTSEMADAVQTYVDYVTEMVDAYVAEYSEVHLHIEKRLSSDLHPYAFGTADVAIEVPQANLLHVIDYKHGKGILVQPDSGQLRMYGAMGLEVSNLKDPDNADVLLTIVQPRIPNGKGLIRSELFDASDLQAWFANEVIPAMLRTEDENAVLQAGTWCRFCPARMSCPALKGEITSFPLDNEIDGLNGQEIGELLEKGAAIKSFLTKLEKEAYKRAINGTKIHNYKLVKKRANRTWKQGAEEALHTKLGDKIYSAPAFLSPAQVEKLIGGKKEVAAWAYTPSPGFTLAPESDSRSEVTPNADFLEPLPDDNYDVEPK